MLAPQLWPHNHHSLAYVSKFIKYMMTWHWLNFFAGFAAILHRPFLSFLGLRSLNFIQLLRVVLSSQGVITTPSNRMKFRLGTSRLHYFDVSGNRVLYRPSVRELYTAVIFEIECGRAIWGDSFTCLESLVSQSPSRYYSVSLRARIVAQPFSSAEISEFT